MKIGNKYPEIILLQFLWVLIILPKTIQFGLLLILLCLALFKSRIRMTKDTLFFCLVGVVQLFSIMMQLLINNPDSERLMAAINTASLWIMAPLFYMIVRNRSYTKIDLEFVSKYIKVNFAILFLVYILSLVVSRQSFTIFGIKMILRKADYLSSGLTTRFCGFMDTVMCPSHFFLILFPLLLYVIKMQKENTWYVLFWGMIALIPVIATHSRMGILVCIAQFLLALWCVMKDRSVNKKVMFGVFFMILLAAVSFVILYLPDIKSAIYSFLNSRGGSNAMRMRIYQNSYEKVMNESPIYGVGIKYMMNAKYPYGSHSTYVGMLYKVGILGAGCFLLALFFLFKSIWRKMCFSSMGKTVFVMMLSYLLFLITSDLDTTDWVPILFFVVAGILIKISDFQMKQIANIGGIEKSRNI